MIFSAHKYLLLLIALLCPIQTIICQNDPALYAAIGHIHIFPAGAQAVYLVKKAKEGTVKKIKSSLETFENYLLAHEHTQPRHREEREQIDLLGNVFSFFYYRFFFDDN